MNMQIVSVKIPKKKMTLFKTLMKEAELEIVPKKTKKNKPTGSVKQENFKEGEKPSDFKGLKMKYDTYEELRKAAWERKK